MFIPLVPTTLILSMIQSADAGVGAILGNLILGSKCTIFGVMTGADLIKVNISVI